LYRFVRNSPVAFTDPTGMFMLVIPNTEDMPASGDLYTGGSVWGRANHEDHAFDITTGEYLPANQGIGDLVRCRLEYHGGLAPFAVFLSHPFGSDARPEVRDKGLTSPPPAGYVLPYTGDFDAVKTRAMIEWLFLGGLGFLVAGLLL